MKGASKIMCSINNFNFLNKERNDRKMKQKNKSGKEVRASHEANARETRKRFYDLDDMIFGFEEVPVSEK